MTQQEVYDFLKKNRGKKFTTSEIEDNLNFKSAHRNLMKLRKRQLNDLKWESKWITVGKYRVFTKIYWIDK